MPEVGEIVAIEITTPLPSEGAVGATYKIEGTVKAFDAVGAPPWVYAEVLKKEWYKPEVIEEVTYERGFPMPITGKFTIDWTPKKEGIYEVTIIATPAPLSLPVIGVSPIVGKSDMMRVEVEKLVHQVKELKIVSYSKNGGAPVTPPTKLKVDPGDEIKVDIEFGYVGPGYRETLYSALYKYTLGIVDEVSGGAGTSAIDIPAATELTTIKSYVIVPVPDRPGETFGLYAKLGNWPPSKYWDDVIEVTGVPVTPQAKTFRIVSYDTTKPGAKLRVTPGDTIRVNVEFDYRGPAWRETLYSALYQYTLGIVDEVSGGTGKKGWDISASEDWATVKGCYVIVPVPNRPGEIFGIYAKLGNILSRLWDDVIEIVEVAPPVGYRLDISVIPAVGYVIKSPDKPAYSPGERVTLTASLDSWALGTYEFDHWAGDATGTSIVTTITMDRDKFVTAVFREVAPPVGISFSVRAYNIPSWLQPVYEWYIIWRGKEYGRWTDISYPITLDSVESTGAMSIVLKHDGATHMFTTRTYTLEDGKTYRLNVEYVILEEA